MTTPRIICVGEGLVVLVAEPGPLEHSETFRRSSGGAESNVAMVLAQLDVPSAWISRVGDDGFGRYLVGQLDKAGVDVSAVTVDHARPTGIYVKQRGAGSGGDRDLALGDSRMTYFRSGSAASALSPTDLTAASALIGDAEFVHFTGITVALSDSTESMTRALVDGCRHVSFDLNFRPALWGQRNARRILADHVRGSSIVFMGADEAQEVFGLSDPDALRREFPEPQHLVVKNDKHVVTAFDGSSRVDVPALTLDVVEKIGAGDAFAGGYLSGLASGLGPVGRVRLGHLCAAGALTGHGDVADIVDSERRGLALALSDQDWQFLDYRKLAAS